MLTVYTKQEMKKALENRESQILVKGELAQTMRKKAKVKKSAKIGGIALVIAGIVAIPFTGGASSVLTGAGVAALTVGTVSLTALELAILCGFVIAMTGVLKGAKVTFNSDGSVTVEPRYK